MMVKNSNGNMLNIFRPIGIMLYGKSTGIFAGMRQLRLLDLRTFQQDHY